MPLPHRRGRVAGTVEHLGERGDVLAELQPDTGEAVIGVRDRGEPGAVRVEAGEHRGPGRRAHRGGVVVREGEPLIGEPLQRRGGDLGPERADVRVAHVVEEDHDDVRGSGRRTYRSGQ